MFLSIPALAIPLAPGASAARSEDGGIFWQMYGIYSMDVLKFSTLRGDANFKGSSVGAGLSQRLATKHGGGLSTRGEISFRSHENTANSRSTSESESLTGTAFLFGVRIYASELFVGAYGTFMPFTVKYTNAADNSRNSEQKYNAFGLGLELGVDVFLSSSLFLTPRLDYQFYSAQPSTGATDGMRVSGYSAGVAAGFVF